MRESKIERAIRRRLAERIRNDAETIAEFAKDRRAAVELVAVLIAAPADPVEVPR